MARPRADTIEELKIKAQAIFERRMRENMDDLSKWLDTPLLISPTI
jgi:hypothetical protein